MSWVEVEMNWVEVDGAGWRWVHGLVILNEKEISFPCSNARDVPVTFYITYIITSVVFLTQLGYLLSILIVILM